MDAYGITDNGYIERYYNDVVNAKRNRAIEKFGSSVDLTDNSVIGQFINATSYEEALIHQIVENVYYSRFVQFATGKALEDVVYAKGIRRKEGVAAIGEVTIKKDATYNGRIYLPKGTIISDMDGLYPYTLDYILEIPAGETTYEYVNPDGTVVTKSYITDGIDVSVTSRNIGADYNVVSNKLCKLAKSVIGISSIANTYATHGGENRESDDELRARAIAYTQHGIGTKENIIAAVKAIEGVKNVNVQEYFVETTGLHYKSLEDGQTIISTALPCSFVVCVNGVTTDNRPKIIETVENARAYGIKAYCAEATAVPMKVSITCTYSSSKSQIAEEVTNAVNKVLNSTGFGGIVTYTELLRNITAINDILDIFELKFTIVFSATETEILEDLGDSIDMSEHEGSYLYTGSVTVNDPVTTNSTIGE